ncbi:MAG: hypothetical protein JNM31_03545 [Flavobacteriales bacterium]|nr:hypothetical protein [Flavobacteriales bacterium]
MRTLSHWLSVLLHPLFMPLFTLVVAFQLDHRLSFFLPPGMRLLTFGMVLVLTVLFPLTSALMLVRGGLVTDLRMERREERIAPFVMTLFYYGLCYYLLRRSVQHESTLALFLGAILALALTLLISLRWKISAHMVGIGGLLGGLSGLLWKHGTFAPTEMALFIVLAGALGTARLLVSDHSPAQVAAGFVLGFACVLATVAGGLAF